MALYDWGTDQIWQPTAQRRNENFGYKCFSRKSQPTLGLPPPGGGGGDSAEGTQNFKKGRQAPPPPPGEGIQATKKWLGPNLEVNFGYTDFFLAADPPPPQYRINQSLSKGLKPIPHSHTEDYCSEKKE